MRVENQMSIKDIASRTFNIILGVVVGSFLSALVIFCVVLVIAMIARG